MIGESKRFFIPASVILSLLVVLPMSGCSDSKELIAGKKEPPPEVRRTSGDQKPGETEPGRKVKFKDVTDAQNYAIGPRDEREKESWKLCRKVVQLDSQGKLREALETARQAASMAPLFPAAWNTLGMVQEHLKDEERAIEAYKKACDLDGSYYTAWRNQTGALARSGRFKQAARVMEHVVELVPDDATNLILMGRLYLEVSKPELAERQFKRALELQPDNGEAWFRLGYEYHGMKRLKDAERAYRRAIKLKNKTAWLFLSRLQDAAGEPRQAERTLERLVELEPDFADGWLELGLLKKKHGDTASARRCYRMASAKNPGFPDGLLQEALILIDSGEYSEAKTLLVKARKLDPEWSRPWYHLGRISMKEHDYKKALHYFEVSTGKPASSADEWNALGAALGYSRRLEDSAVAYRRATEISPRFATGWANLAVTMSKLGKHEDARRLARKAVTMKPSNGFALSTLAKFSIDDEKPDQALKLLSRAVKLNPRYAYAWYLLGAAYQANGEEKEGERALKKAVSLDENLSYPWMELAKLYGKRGETEKTVAALKRAIKAKQGRDTEDLYRIAYQLEKMGLKKDASLAMKTGLNLEPDEADVLVNIPFYLEQGHETGGSDQRPR